MRELMAYGTLALTVGLAVGRPRLIGRWNAGPATAAILGVSFLLLVGLVEVGHVFESLALHWRPFITIVSIMIIAAAAQRLEVLDQLAERLFSRSDLSVEQLFSRVFFLSALISSVLNNDAMVLLLTPLVLTLVRKRYPGHTRLLAPFAFSVFMAVGVAPFVVSNPMNMIVAEYARLNFNQYASWMVPVAIPGWLITYAVLRYFYREELATDLRAADTFDGPVRFSAAQKGVLALLGAVVVAYPVIALIDGPSIWMAAAAGAAISVVLAWGAGGVNPRELLVAGVAWDVLLFLLGVYIIAIGLRNAGFTDLLAGLYTDAGLFTVGGTAALGSAVVNNHPMAIINLLALEATPGAGRPEIMAGLIGGDLGPRFLPIGSLAGLLWIEGCRRMGLQVSVKEFIRLGLAAGIPALAVSLGILYVRTLF